MQDLWAHLRGVLVVLHLLAVTLMAFPAPGGGMARSAWQDPTVQAEFDAWYAVFRKAGADLSRARFEEELWQAGTSFMDARRKVLAPFQPYYRYAGTTQTWRMFVAPQRFPARLWIEIEEGGQFRPIYKEKDPELNWNARQLDHDRMRSLVFRFAWKPYQKPYRQWVEWLAPQVAAAFPEATRMRTRYARQRSPSPDEAREGVEPPVHFEFAIVKDLKGLR